MHTRTYAHIHTIFTHILLSVHIHTHAHILYRYADRAKQIKNKPRINEDPKDTLLRQYKEVCVLVFNTSVSNCVWISDMCKYTHTHTHTHMRTRTHTNSHHSCAHAHTQTRTTHIYYTHMYGCIFRNETTKHKQEIQRLKDLVLAKQRGTALHPNFSANNATSPKAVFKQETKIGIYTSVSICSAHLSQ